VSTPSYNELVAAVRQEGEGIVSATRQGLQLTVPTCGEWTLRDLSQHVGSIYAYVSRIVGERLTSSPGERPAAPDDVDPVEFLAHSLDELVEALAGCEPATPVWNWSAEPDEAAFWARRMAHESSVHRFDAQRAHGVAQPVDADMAADGLDELIEVIAPRAIGRNGVDGEHTYAFHATDEGEWTLRLTAEALERLATVKAPDVTARGTASALFLAACNRVPWSSLEIDGDTEALDLWSRAMSF
jgi:uncharacterized protein (TIGR03083 family)